jgi:hypothetical protein
MMATHDLAKAQRALLRMSLEQLWKSDRLDRPKNVLESRRIEMSQTIESKNKALVLEAFDTLFNKHDYVAAERYWSPDYIQHSAHIEPSRGQSTRI